MIASSKILDGSGGVDIEHDDAGEAWDRKVSK